MLIFRYILKRLVMVIPVVLGVLLIIFFFQFVSDDDPATIILGSDSPLELREELREELGLNDPFFVQYGRYVWNFVSKGDLGNSYKSGQPVFHELMVRFPVTLRVAIVSTFLGVFIGIPLGVLAAVKQYTAVDSAIVGFSVLIESMPNFWLALMLITLFSVRLGWLPTSGIETAKAWIMPTFCVAISSCSMLIRVTRASMLETIRQDYILMARAKGQTEFKITTRHILRNSLIPILAAVGNGLGVQLGGALIVESIFGMPGVGKYALDAINNRNYPSILGGVVFLAISFAIVNLIVDLTFAFVDPKLKTSLIRERKHKIGRGDAARGTDEEAA